MVAVDLNPVIVGVAEAGVETTAIEFVRADARSLPFTDEAFDAATCSLALHHFEPDDAVAVLRELARVVRFGIVVNDLIRSWHGYAGALVLSRLATRNPVTRHDAPLSVRRAYTRSELDVLLAHAGLRRLAAFGLLGVRVAVAAERV